jgi:hypothetical protein
MLCRCGPAPSGPRGSAPCPCDACSQANNTAAAFLPAARIAIAGCVGSRFLLSSARAPPRPQSLWAGNQDASQVHREGMDDSAEDNPGTHRSPIVAPTRTKAALGSRNSVTPLKLPAYAQPAGINMGRTALAALPRSHPGGVDKDRDACPDLTTDPANAYKTAPKAFSLWAKRPTRSVFPPAPSRPAETGCCPTCRGGIRRLSHAIRVGLLEGEASHR